MLRRWSLSTHSGPMRSFAMPAKKYDTPIISHANRIGSA
jgi:hypothetical protein